MNNLHIDTLLDVAYEIAREQFQGEQFSFSVIWSKTWKAASAFKKEPVENWIGYFYTQLQLDPRFVAYSNTSWCLKEFMNYTEFKKLNKSIFSDSAILVEDFEKSTTSKFEKPEKEKFEKYFNERTDDEEAVAFKDLDEEEEKTHLENRFASDI